MKISDQNTLEHQLYLKQLQINRLLEITQAINNNLASKDLFKIYKAILSWEMNVEKFILLIKEQSSWNIVANTGVPQNLLREDVSPFLSKFKRTTHINETNALLKEFKIVIPVYHKNNPIAFAFIGSLDNSLEFINQVQFITTITNIIAVAIENKRLFKKQIEQERSNRDMELAVQMQNLLIPEDLPIGKHYNFSGIYQPHSGVGGDYYDVINLDNGEIAFCIADISGKGVAAALLMSNFQANLQSLIHRDLSAEDFIYQLNKSVLNITKGDKFITFFVAKFDPNTNYLRYVNAGHNAPLLFHKNELQSLNKGCTILGIFDNLPQIELGEYYLETDALLLMYTDGLTELINEADEFFDSERLEKFILSNNQKSPKEINEELMKVIEEFKGSNGFSDDISILTCRLHK